MDNSKVTYKKLQSGEWGIVGPNLTRGAVVTVHTKSGDTDSQIVDRVIWASDDRSVCIATMRKGQPSKPSKPAQAPKAPSPAQAPQVARQAQPSPGPVQVLTPARIPVAVLTPTPPKHELKPTVSMDSDDYPV